MTRNKLLQILLSIKALLENDKQEKSIELINELIAEIENTTDS